ncbi:MAG: tetratricopeptide repeat protein [Proteobacteria bacterium]|nr:tetratricopeptide repeat protein [Pseudomonadota bacterium]
MTRPLPPSSRLVLAAMLGLALAAPGLAQTPATQPASPATPAPPPAGPVSAPPSAARPDAGPGLSAETFYRVLVGDVALQRGQPAIAARAYYEAAKDTHDLYLARRATELAVVARQRTLADASARLWLAADPAADRPKQILAALASGAFGAGAAETDTIDGDVRARIAKLIADAAATPQGPGELFLQLNRGLAQEPDKDAVYNLIVQLAAPFPDLAEAHFAVALAAYNTGMKSMTLAAAAQRAIDRALVLKPGWDRAALLKADLIERQSRADAIAYLRDFYAQHPDAKPAAGALAQLYVEDNRPGEARAIFEALSRAEPNAPEYEFGVAALSMQMRDWDTAERLFQDLKAKHYGENGVVEFNLATIAEEQKHYDEAIRRYKEVPDGERGWLAQLRIAIVLGKAGKLDEGRRWLAGLNAVSVEQKIQVKQADAQLLRDANDNAAAYAVLAAALVDHPESTDLLYDSAMVAEKLDRPDESEAKLKQLVKLKPDDAQALNALGYTLVDRGGRVEEGYQLISRALTLSPDDPFILDSMGWALYRMGRYDDALTYLKRALDGRPDAEIAAHYGEVLWAKGEHDRARVVWQSQLRTTPDNPVLLETVRRYSP